MTISTSTSRVAYTATASQTVFAVPFVFWDDSDLLVYVEGTLKTLTTHYTVSGGDGATGTVTFVSGQTADDSVVIEREVPATRTTDFPLSGNFNIGTLNTQLDKLFAILQQQNTDLGRAIIEDTGYGGLDLMLPAPADRADKFLAFDDDGNVTVAETPASATAGYKFKVSGNDTTGGYLNGKLVAGSGITLTEGSDGSDETLTAAVALATTAEIKTGTEAAKAIAPDQFAGARASQAEAEAGALNTVWMSCLRVFQAIAAYLTTFKATANRWSKAQRGDVVTLTDAATIAVDFDLANNFTVTLAGNRTLGNPTNMTAGQGGIIEIIQDGTGSRTLAYSSYWKFPNGTAPTLTTTASRRDVLAYQVLSTTIIAATLIQDVR